MTLSLKAADERAIEESLTPALAEFWAVLRHGGEYPPRELRQLCLAGCGAPSAVRVYLLRLRRKLLPFGLDVEAVRRRGRTYYRLARVTRPDE